MKEKETKETIEIENKHEYRPPTKAEFITCASLLVVIVLLVFFMFRNKEEA